MLIWSGFGILIIPIVFVSGAIVFGVGVNLVALLFGDSVVDHTGGVLGGLTLLLAAAVTRRLSRYLDARGTRMLLDPATGEQVLLEPHHSFFFIKMRYWPIIMVPAAGTLALVSLVQGITLLAG